MIEKIDVTTKVQSKFRKPYDHAQYIPANQNCRANVGDFLEEYDKHGISRFNRVGSVNAFDEVQSHAEYSDLKNVIKRFQLGDETALGNPEKAIYADVSHMTMNLMEAQNMINSAKADFDKLDVETKKRFNNNFMEYAASAGTHAWFKALGYQPKEAIKEVVDPVEKMDAPKGE